ncbi:MAG: hypothetical protein JXB85_05085 [Anaerolineales bacterium]|nr:hypothetical protein [Anaerolineales bacterium]
MQKSLTETKGGRQDEDRTQNQSGKNQQGEKSVVISCAVTLTAALLLALIAAILKLLL